MIIALAQLIRPGIKTLTIFYASSFFYRCLWMGFCQGFNGVILIGIVTLIAAIYLLTKFKFETLDSAFDVAALLLGVLVGLKIIPV